MRHKQHLLKVVLKNYCHSTTLHGYKYLFQPKRPLIEKCIWSAILIVTILMTCYIFDLLLDDYNNNVTITALSNAKYDIKKVPFPAVAICDVNRISQKQIIQISSEMHQKMNISEDELYVLFKNFGNLYDFNLNSPVEILNLHNIMERYYYPNLYYNFSIFFSILQKLTPACSQTIRKCYWMGQEMNCNQIFASRRTMHGFCCTFNYIKSWNVTELASFNGELGNNNKEGLHFKGAGSDTGLTIAVYSDPNDYYYPLENTEGFSVKIFNALDYPDIASGALIENLVPLKKEIFIQISATTIKAFPELYTIPTNKRGCMFNNEGKTVFDRSFYSYSDCLADCKLRSILALCECVPFLLPVLKSYGFSEQICSLIDIPCLNKFDEKWKNIYPSLNIEELDFERENSLFCPNCLPSCFSTSYNVEINYAVLNKLPYKEVSNSELNKYSLIHIYSDTEDIMLYESDVTYYWFDIIANFGGTCSLFMGFSLISIVELIYFITVKYYRLAQNKNNKILHCTKNDCQNIYVINRTI